MKSFCTASIVGNIELVSAFMLFAYCFVDCFGDVAAVVDVIVQGAAGSWQMENRAATMLEGKFDFGFAVDWMRKDLGMAIEEAARSGALLPAVEEVDGRYAELQRRGAGRLDTSGLIMALRPDESSH